MACRSSDGSYNSPLVTVDYQLCILHYTFLVCTKLADHVALLCVTEVYIILLTTYYAYYDIIIIMAMFINHNIKFSEYF